MLLEGLLSSLPPKEEGNICFYLLEIYFCGSSSPVEEE